MGKEVKQTLTIADTPPTSPGPLPSRGGSLASSSGPRTLGLRAYFIWCFTEFFKQD